MSKEKLSPETSDNSPSNWGISEELKKKGEALIRQIPTTHFMGVLNKNGKWVVVFGKDVISEREFDSYEELEKDILRMDWLMITNVCGIITEFAINELKAKLKEGKYEHL